MVVSKIDSNTVKCINNSSTKCRSLPEDCIPVVKKRRDLLFNSRHCIPQQIPHYPQYFEDYIQMQEEWVQKLILHHIHNLIEERLLIHI